MAAATDYASVIWSSGATLKTISILDQVQQIESQAITGAFCTTALVISKVKASFLRALDRIHNQQLKTWIKWHTKPGLHRLGK